MSENLAENEEQFTVLQQKVVDLVSFRHGDMPDTSVGRETVANFENLRQRGRSFNERPSNLRSKVDRLMRDQSLPTTKNLHETADHITDFMFQSHQGHIDPIDACLAL